MGRLNTQAVPPFMSCRGSSSSANREAEEHLNDAQQGKKYPKRKAQAQTYPKTKPHTQTNPQLTPKLTTGLTPNPTEPNPPMTIPMSCGTPTRVPCGMRASYTMPLAGVAMQNMCKHLKTMFQVLLCIWWEGQSMQ